MTIALYIDGQLAAFLSGMTDGVRLVVPRLSINDEYRRYSPGAMLISEAIKMLASQSTIRVLDLSKGEEPYKYQLGGRIHKAYSCRL